MIVDADILRDSAQQFAEREYSFTARQKSVASDGSSVDRYWLTFADLGWLGAALPEDVGGIGGSIAETCVIMEQLGRALIAEPLLGSAVLAAQVLSRIHDAPGVDELLAKVSAGEIRVALAYEEDNSRGNFLTARAEASREGEFYRISGHKIAVLGAPHSHKLIVTASVGSELALFVVDAHANNVETLAYRGYDGLSAANIRFKGVEVPASAKIASDATAQAALHWGFDQFRMAEAAIQLGVMQVAFEMTRDYLKTRKQFGKALAEFQVLQHRLADIYINIEEARALHRRCLAIAQKFGEIDAVSLATMMHRMRNAARFVAMQTVQLHGGIGMTDEYIVGHCCRYLTVAGLRHGNARQYLDVLADKFAARDQGRETSILRKPG